MHFGAPSRFRKGRMISLQNLHSYLPFFDPAENKKVDTYFDIRRQFQNLTTSRNDMMTLLVSFFKAFVALSEYLNFTVTSDEDESDDEILQFKDDGIDYAYLWDEQSIKPKSAELQDIKMDNSLLEELKFFTLNKDLKKFTPTDDAYLEKLGIVHELETIIKSGEYRKLIKQQEISPAEPAKADLSKVQASITKVPQEIKLLLKMTPSSSVTKSATSIAQIATKAPDHELMPPPAKVNSPPVIASIVTPAQNRTSETAPEDEDNAIQNLLDDIRGSFERQFDDEFNDFTETAASEGEHYLILFTQNIILYHIPR
jgi:hypothetical protein